MSASGACEMARITRKSAWIVVGVIGVAGAAAFLGQRAVAPPTPAQPASRTAATSPAPSAPHAQKLDAEAPAAQPDAIPFSPRIYPATPVTAAAPGAPSSPAASATGPTRPVSSTAPPAASSGFFPQTRAADNAVLADLSRLRAAADAGDAEAACRVGVALAHCASMPSQVSATSRGPVLSNMGCAAVSPQDMQAASRYLSQASAAGSAAARRAIAGDASVSAADCSP